MKNFLVLCYLYWTIKHAHSLECYFTDLAAVKAGNLGAEPLISNCEDYLSQLEDSGLNLFNTSLNLRCYKVELTLDRADIAVQGCGPQDSCRDLHKQIFLEDANIKKMTCTECEEDGCNSGVTRAVVVKRWLNRKYLAITVVVVIVFMCVISLILRKFSQRSQRSDFTYAQLKV